MNVNQNMWKGNLANGSLMRRMPLILYGYKLNKNILFNIIKEDSSLTHYNKYVYYINGSYCICCQYLLNNYNDKKKYWCT